MLHHFFKYEDLSYKANSFITTIQELRQLGGELQNFIQQETTEQTGEIIETINESIQIQEKMNHTLHDAYETIMKNMASDYSYHILDMNGQDITLYYEIIINKKQP